MKGNKSRFGLRSRLMGTCFSTDNDKIPQEQQRLSSKGNQEAGLGHDRSPTRSNGPEMVEIKRTSSISSIPKNVTDLRNSPGYSNVDIFTYEEMTLATKHFRPDYILGEGGFGVVYKGVLDKSVRPGYKTTYVAIKELNPDGLQGDREWLAEVNYLGQLSHQNLVKLIGYCCEGEHRLLVYEYMASGSLENHLFHRVGCTLTWSKRMKFALDAAKGLASLHGAERSVIYRDFKTSNILLDSMAELAKNIRELKSILYGNSESEPVSEACAQLTQEFFRENTLRLLIVCLPQLNLEARKDATQIVANLQRQQVNSRLIASWRKIQIFWIF